MANIQVVCPVVPDTNFSYEAGQTRYTEQLSFVLLHNIALAAGAGISVQYVSESEVSSLESAFSSASSQWMSFIDAIVPEAVGVDVPAIPDPADIDVYTGGGWEGLLLYHKQFLPYTIHIILSFDSQYRKSQYYLFYLHQISEGL